MNNASAVFRSRAASLHGLDKRGEIGVQVAAVNKAAFRNEVEAHVEVAGSDLDRADESGTTSCYPYSCRNGEALLGLCSVIAHNDLRCGGGKQTSHRGTGCQLLPHRSGEVAEVLDRAVRAVAPVRAKLIAKGMIFNSAHGDTAFYRAPVRRLPEAHHSVSARRALRPAISLRSRRLFT